MTNRLWKAGLLLTATCLALMGFTLSGTLSEAETSDVAGEHASCDEDYDSYFSSTHSGLGIAFDAYTEISGCTYGSMYLEVDCTVKENGNVIWTDSHGSWDDNGDGFSVEVDFATLISGSSYTSTCTHSFVYPTNVNQYTTTDSWYIP